MRFCVVGCGEHASSSHGPSLVRYAAEHPGFERVACCDLDATRAENYRVRFGFARSDAEMIAMVERQRPDAVLVAVLPHAIASVAAPLLERGVPLLIEKPPGLTVEEVDRLITAAERGGRSGGVVPHQVGFNRRYVPLVREAMRRLAQAGPVQHVRYEMTRYERREPDFSTTAVHGLDTVRVLTGSDYAEARFRYQEQPQLGPGVANMVVDAVMASGATAQLAFHPVAGVIVERATIHAENHTLFLDLPVAGSSDIPGRLRHLERGVLKAEQRGPAAGPDAEPYVLAGFFAQYEAFFEALAAGRAPSPGLRESRQSVALAACLRHRETVYRS